MSLSIKKLYIFFILIFSIIFLPACGQPNNVPESDQGSGYENHNPIDNNEANDSETNESEQPNDEETEIFFLAAGKYSVSADLPAGEYILIPTGAQRANFELTYGVDKIVYNTYCRRKFIKLDEGDKISFQNAVLYRSDNAPLNLDTDLGLPSGQYKAGRDIAAGEYILVDNDFDFNYMQLTSLPIAQTYQAEFIGNTIFHYRQYFSIADGQYIEFNEGKLYALEAAPSIITNDDLSLKVGQYKAGTHIRAGIYRFIPEKGETNVYFITAEPLTDYNNYLEVGIHSEPVLVNLNAGEYITIRSGRLSYIE